MNGAARIGADPLRPAPAQVVTLGETMAMMRSGQIGSLAHLPSIDLSLGGAESNVAIGLVRLGVPTAWVGRVGADPLGERVAREIRAEGVLTCAVVDPTRPTGLMIKSRPTGSTTRVDYYRTGSAGSVIAPEDVPAGLIESARVLHLSGITPMLSPTARESVHAALARARAAGVLVSFDVNHRSALGDRAAAAAACAELAAAADVVFGGPEELGIIAPGGPLPADHLAEDADDATTEELLHAVAASGDHPRQVILKRGAHGAAVVEGGTYRAAPGLTVDVVDTVGAGDAFVAGYLSALLEGLDAPGRLERANACGAAACTTAGDWEGAPRRADLERVLRGAGGDPVQR